MATTSDRALAGIADETAGRSPGPRAHAAHRAVEANRTHLHFTVVDLTVDISMPPMDKLAFYGGLAGAATFGVITWPIALLTGVGHLLAEDRNNRTLRALGTALDAAA